VNDAACCIVLQRKFGLFELETGRAVIQWFEFPVGETGIILIRKLEAAPPLLTVFLAQKLA
jgi:hypothetical protein